jgi:predicted CXXCH cytochrome family protein
MKITTACLLITFLLIGSASASKPNQCVVCHLDWEDDDGPSHLYSKDVHGQRGLGCEDCHGGDPTLEDMDEVRESVSFVGVPHHLEVPEFCARCHSDASYMREHNPSLPVDQLTKYRTSVHGQKLFSEKDELVANCVSCHSGHQIANAQLPYSSVHPLNLPATCGKCHSDAEYMTGRDIPTNQLELYRQSVHGQALLERHDLGAPACNDCHGNHAASPPGSSSLAAVCGLCHAMEAELFADSPHAEAFAENDFPICETCHGNHAIFQASDDMIGIAEPAFCVECHSNDDGTLGFITADSVAKSITSLVEARSEAAAVLAEAREKGMMTTDEEFRLKEVDQILVQARTLVHTFNIDSVSSKTQVGLAAADTVAIASASLIDEYYFRRKGLALASLFITLLVALLWRKIRQIDRSNQANQT